MKELGLVGESNVHNHLIRKVNNNVANIHEAAFLPAHIDSNIGTNSSHSMHRDSLLNKPQW